MRKKDTKNILGKIKDAYGVELSGEIDKVDIDGRTVFLVNNEPLLMEHDGNVYFTVYGIIKLMPGKGRVVVDEGAVKFIMNGADVMKPGIVEADESLKQGDFCYIVVEKKLTPLAVGVALVDGADMIGEKGKAIENIHHLNDKIWKFFFKK
ncbi:conserved protein with predicted RNA binding PUA domain [Geoglobus acetivorans]|uniref:Conserved protein with predicted RNA binding PUA domain n=1 Tax=Geoglobus acetivorans TaxID=565033 RepID=A0A0A7GHH1_GEOAI|nr:conserved protein with predicted RNA binding PUA domain [Geoglobus acetivorans]